MCSVFYAVYSGQTCHLPARCPPTPILSPLPLTFCPQTHLHTHTNTHCPYGAVGAQKRPKQPDPFPGQEVRVPAACLERVNACVSVRVHPSCSRGLEPRTDCRIVLSVCPLSSLSVLAVARARIRLCAFFPTDCVPCELRGQQQRTVGPRSVGQGCSRVRICVNRFTS